MRHAARALVLLLCVVASARACLNDQEVGSNEREFRSRYGMPPAEAQPPASPWPGPRAVLGIALGLGALGIALLEVRERRRRARDAQG